MERAAPEGHLSHGKACISCRRRKMKCDGVRPYCGQCVRLKRTDDCEYTDTQGRTRTQVLEERVTSLQARLDELENPQVVSSSVLLQDPYGPSTSGALRRGHSDSTGAPMSYDSGTLWWEFEEPPSQIAEMFLGTFIEHARDVGFVLSTDSLISDFYLSPNEPKRPHPALLNAIFLWALRFSKSHDFMQHEPLYLQRTIVSLLDALHSNSTLDESTIIKHRIQAVQTEVLLARYFFLLGRFLEGRYHINAAVSLSVSFGLHRLSITSNAPAASETTMRQIGHLELPPAMDFVELDERIRIFWVVFTMDRTWSSVLRMPIFLTDGDALNSEINTPWALSTPVYSQSSSSFQGSIITSRTIRRFLSGEIPIGIPLSNQSLLAMVSLLFERSIRLSMSLTSGSLHPEVLSVQQLLDQVYRLVPTIESLSLENLELNDLQAAHELITIHILMSASSIIASHLIDNNSERQALLKTYTTTFLQAIEKLVNASPVAPDPIISMICLEVANYLIADEQAIVNLRTNLSHISDTITSPVFAQQLEKIMQMKSS